MPEESVLLAAGFLAGRGILRFEMVAAVAAISAVIGDNFGYLLGRTGGRRVLARMTNRWFWLRRRHEQFLEFFKIHGNKTIFLARFVTGLRFVAGPMAGAAGMPFGNFFGWNILGALVWCTAVVTLGYLLGDEWEAVARLFHQAGPWVVVGLALLVLAAYMLWWRERSRANDPV